MLAVQDFCSAAVQQQLGRMTLQPTAHSHFTPRHAICGPPDGTWEADLAYCSVGCLHNLSLSWQSGYDTCILTLSVGCHLHRAARRELALHQSRQAC